MSSYLSMGYTCINEITSGSNTVMLNGPNKVASHCIETQQYLFP